MRLVMKELRSHKDRPGVAIELFFSFRMRNPHVDDGDGLQLRPHLLFSTSQTLILVLGKSSSTLPSIFISPEHQRMQLFLVLGLMFNLCLLVIAVCGFISCDVAESSLAGVSVLCVMGSSSSVEKLQVQLSVLCDAVPQHLPFNTVHESL
ncbi:hypothetical protein DNTS_033665 [Danionella cerebrum]|uniref:Uncharacterized protein n=1 Tax=Danionella cerebrum TaxID=2873325 RepID=A0A553RFT6_9TELE|nr:hypothetical protein DNTS_033665 [Danionella translucida]